MVWEKSFPQTTFLVWRIPPTIARAKPSDKWEEHGEPSGVSRPVMALSIELLNTRRITPLGPLDPKIDRKNPTLEKRHRLRVRLELVNLQTTHEVS